MKRNPDGTRMTRKDKILAKKREEERAKFEKEFREKSLINKTLRNLKSTYDKYEEQKQFFVKMAKEAKDRGLIPQYNMAKNGLKIVMSSQEKASSMYLNLAISNQIKQTVGDTKQFILSMSQISKQLSEVNSEIDFAEAQQNYDYAMHEISMMEEKLQDFSENINSSLEDYAVQTSEDAKVDKAIETLINTGLNGGGEALKPNVVNATAEAGDSYFSDKIRALDQIINEIK